MRLISYNILNPYHAVKWNTLEGLTSEDAQDNWELDRRTKVFKNLQDSQFDIACLQEISERTLQEFQHQFSLAAYFPHTSYDEPASVHGTAIIYNPALLTVVRCRELIASIAKQRSATLVDLQHKVTKKTVRVVSVHLKGYNPYEENIDLKRQDQKTGDRELKYYLDALYQDVEGVDGIMIAGDFNEDLKEMQARGMTSRQGVLIQQGFVWDGESDVTETRSGRKIDWIFYKDLSRTHGEITQLSEGIQSQHLKHVTVVQDRSASDHAITACDLLSLSE